MTSLPSVVFDTNVLVSAILSTKGASYALVRLAAEGKIVGYTSKTLMDEFREIIQRDYEVSPERANRMVDVFLQFLKIVDPTIRLDAVREDPDDNRVLECAAMANAKFVVSWDPHLTKLGRFEEIQILNPGKMLGLLK
ncbi:putative toxin-antitoxin system toxin component, PIN family [Candidatus Micrarchaeota archaeon]|nr:putative toxin-antitoxin system toxin component, PIN family [Candidatus Micrarchaeota archaeon]